MSEKNLEIEVKVLLGDKVEADRLLKKMKKNDAQMRLIEESSQLNHYYLPGSFTKLFKSLEKYFDDSQKEYFDEIAYKGSNHSIRSRWLNGKVLFVLKAGRSINEQGANGPNRMEMEVEVPLTIEALDKLIQEAGFVPQSKWSRQRAEYEYKGMHVCLDKNAGYGYVAEFEKIVPKNDNVDNANKARAEILMVLKEVDLEELDQDRLDRMFAFYNKHWPEYYGTENTFVID